MLCSIADSVCSDSTLFFDTRETLSKGLSVFEFARFSGHMCSCRCLPWEGSSLPIREFAGGVLSCRLVDDFHRACHRGRSGRVRFLHAEEASTGVTEIRLDEPREREGKVSPTCPDSNPGFLQCIFGIGQLTQDPKRRRSSLRVRNGSCEGRS